MIDTETLTKLVQQLEDHACHPFLHTREAIEAKATDEAIAAALEADYSHIDDILNEVDHRVSKITFSIRNPELSQIEGLVR